MSEGKCIPMWWDGGQVAETLHQSKCGGGGVSLMPDKGNFGAVLQPVAIQGNLIGRDAGGPHGVGASDEGAMYTLTKADVHGVAVPIQDGREMNKRQNGLGVGQSGDPAYTLDQTGAQAVAHPVPYDLFQITAPVNRQNRKPGDPCHTLARDNAAHAAVAFPIDGRNAMRDADKLDAINRQGMGVGATGDPSHTVTSACVHAVATTMAVRRLTPVECERLQGFPDGYTAIPWRGKGAQDCPDGPRYRALGNSMAVPCMRWIGERIAQVDALP